jgi:hypothetical protein
MLLRYDVIIIYILLNIFYKINKVVGAERRRRDLSRVQETGSERTYVGLPDPTSPILVPCVIPVPQYPLLAEE